MPGLLGRMANENFLVFSSTRPVGALSIISKSFVISGMAERSGAEINSNPPASLPRANASVRVKGSPTRSLVGLPMIRLGNRRFLQ